ncbi:helix-turn-helix transcriptional regulator [Variovorax paradoxus]|uniref:helix-turn-helix transcriptional regulator n=1 Tax=Variovorax paradoxus TaxID=34073 RepID=UPI003D646819
MNAFATLISPVPAATIRPSLFAQRRAAAPPAKASSGPALPMSRGSHAAGAAPLFYSDDKPLPPLASQGDATGLVAGLRNAPDHAARKALMKEQLRAIGFEWMGYGSFEDLQGALRPLSVLVSYAHEAWIRGYFSQRHHEVDTRANDVPVSGLPLVWDLESLAQSQCRQPLQAETEARDTAARRRMLLDEMEASGIRSGISFRLATPGHMHEHTFIDLMSGAPGRGWIAGATVGRALMLGLSVHEHVSRHVRKPVAAMQGHDEPLHARSPISPTQQSILESLLRGLGDKEIAYTLGLSSHAVDYHMRQLRRRFGVRNRVQLVSAAADWQP